ncbi:MAG: hypothetical protein KBT63_07140 [Porticoccaceae bacterium]|nr:hypothetical protein [Porticoccaceae bacterium]
MRYLVLSIFLILWGCAEKEQELPWNELPSMDIESEIAKSPCNPVEYDYSKDIISSVPVSIDLPEENSYGPANWTRLGKTCLKASISARLYRKPENQKYNHYTISVESPRVINRCISEPVDGKCETKETQVSSVLYYQRLTMNMVGTSFKGVTMSELVTFDEEKRKVTFLVNEKEYEFQL